MTHTKTEQSTALADAVVKGLSGTPKSLPSWLFYDEEGDRLFQQIMRMPEYYPTRCEYDILQAHKHDLLESFQEGAGSFRIIELGAGDGLKTEVILKYFVENKARFVYLPVDISHHALDMLSARLTSGIPALQIKPQNKTYEEALADLRDSSEKNVILFMGANIGNFTLEEAISFLKKLARPLQKRDLILIGFDLKKDPRRIQEAYDDPNGFTANFNLNMLRRLNRELGANFNTEHFRHYPCYDPHTGTTRSYLMSTINQTVNLGSLERNVQFSAWEPIQTEISQKYDMPMIEKVMALTGLRIRQTFTDAQNYFCDMLVGPA